MICGSANHSGDSGLSAAETAEICKKHTFDRWSVRDGAAIATLAAKPGMAVKKV